VLILAIGIIVGLKNGFIKTVAKPVRVFLSFLASVSWSEPLGARLIKPWISAPLTNKLASYITEVCNGLTADMASEEMPSVIKFAASLYDIDLNEVAKGTGEALAQSIVSAVTDPFVGIVSTVLAFAIIFIVSSLVLGLVLAIINKLAEDGGLIEFVNRAFGCVTMFLFAFLIVWALVSASDIILNIPAVHDMAWVQEFTGGYIFKFFKNFSPIEIILSF
jgi:uncharacterized membrane protein required for colicin V production